MCGIAGFAGFKEEGLLGRMCRAIAHRGPDDDGFYVENDISLGMRRLSVIDLVTGKQPITNEDGSVIVVYNGEIYNYRELREDLQSRGHTLRTASDTECIVHLYEEMGEECVLKLNGMFSFALWDRNQRRLLLARDRVGIKPLSYLALPGKILFGSEIKSLLEHREWRPELDPAALHDYFTYMYVPGPRSIFKGVRKLLPGHTLTWEASKGVKIRRYWEVPEPVESDLSERDCCDQLDAVLAAAVKRQMVSDVPIGAYLSGGLDSSLVVALMQKAGAAPVRTFSIGYGKRAPLYDELPYARLVAKALGTEHHELEARPNVVDLLDKVAWHLDEPYANSSAIPAYLISREARRRVTVMLSGAGGDEIFAGYPRNIAARWLGAYTHLPRAIRRMISTILERMPESTEGRHAVRRLREFARGALLDAPDAYLQWVAFYNEEEKRRLYSGDMVREVEGLDSFDSFRRYVSASRNGGYLDRMLFLDLKTWLPFNILEYSDKMSMMASLEARVPLLDNELLDFASRIPERLKVKGFTGKYLLKKVAGRHLPHAIVHRRKKGFMVPIGIWIKEDLRELILDLLSEKVLRERGYFDSRGVHQILRDHFDGRRDYSHHIWMLLMFEMWHRTFLSTQSACHEAAPGRQILSPG